MLPMKTIKLIVTHRGNLEKKYGAAGVKRIDKAVASVIAADKKRKFVTHYLHLDDSAEMKKYGVTAITGKATAEKCKRTIDQLFAALSPDYLALLGADDVIPHFLVPNPSFSESDGDDDESAPTDNPYACSRAFAKNKRASYLIPDRVIGRIPDLPGSSDPAWLLDYLKVAASWQPGVKADYADDLMICCDEWKSSGEECVSYVLRDPARLMISPPVGFSSAQLKKRHQARFHLIKCHGARIDSAFYGQQGNSYPPSLTSESLLERTSRNTVVGAMCCYGAALFDPDDPAAVSPGTAPIPSVYLRQGAYGFVGSSTIAWVGSEVMMCADWIISAYLRGVMRGASLGRSLLEAKQDFLDWTKKQGFVPGRAEEKTLLQFMLLGDPSIHPVQSTTPAPAIAAATVRAPVAAGPGAAEERRARRAFRHQIGEELRSELPQRTPVKRSAHAATSAFEQLAAQMKDVSFGKPLVEEVSRPITQPELTTAGMRRVTAAGARASGPVARQKTVEYYWIGRKKTKQVIDARLVRIETDQQGRLIRTQVLVSA
jgi:hypothetical protein